MKIEKIKKMPSGKYKIEFDSNDKIVTYDDVILKNNLLFNQKIDAEKLNKLAKDTDYYDIYNKAISYISKKLRSEKEIKEYIEKYTTIEKDKKTIIDNLKRVGLINDKVFAKAFISDKINLSNIGPYKIKEELYAHQIDPQIIEKEMSNIDEKEIIEKLNKLINKKVSADHKHSNYMLKQKLTSDMINLGYEKEMIIKVFDGIEFKSDAIDKEYDRLYNKLIKKDTKDIYKQIKNKLYQKGFEIDEINEIINRKVDN